MAKIKISDKEIKAIVNEINESEFFIAGVGGFNLPLNYYERFVQALMGNSPNTKLSKLYQEVDAEGYRGGKGGK